MLYQSIIHSRIQHDFSIWGVWANHEPHKIKVRLIMTILPIHDLEQ